MVHADLVKAVPVGEIGHGIHGVGGHVTWRKAGRLKRQVDNAVPRHPVLGDIGGHPPIELRNSRSYVVQLVGYVGEALVLRRLEMGVDSVDLRLGDLENAVLDPFPIGLHQLPVALDPHLVDDDLDACLVDVVGAARTCCRREGSIPRRTAHVPGPANPGWYGR